MVEASAYARLGILGNPSDLYGGCVFAIPATNWKATAQVCFEDEIPGCHDPVYGFMVQAILDEYGAHTAPPPTVVHGINWQDKVGVVLKTSIPEQVGLGGSSALIIAGLKALDLLFDTQRCPSDIAVMAWRVETKRMGIAAGLQDRVVQSFGIPIYMDFIGFDMYMDNPAFTHYPTKMPWEFYVAWDKSPQESSGAVHATSGDEWKARRYLMAAASNLPDLGLAYMDLGRTDKFADLMRWNYELRCEAYGSAVGSRDQSVVSALHFEEFGAKLAGSGGSVVVLNRFQGDRFDRASDIVSKLGYDIARVQV